jgi:carboxyl-terminal processing protease
MQEHGQYTIIGQKTYGKGIAQITRSLEANPDLFLHITNAKWFTPFGNWIHFQGGSGGIEPDVNIEKSELERSMKVYLYHQDDLMYDTVSDDNIILQIILNGMGYTVRTDGYYDLNTRNAVEDIQGTNGLTITGNVDDQTAIIINQWLSDYQTNSDSQLQEAVDYLID